MDLETKVKNSVELLKSVVQDDVPLIVNFSGGKDSLICLLLALKATDRVECLFMDSGQELPDTLPYVQERCNEFNITLNVSHPCRDRIPHKKGKIPQDCCLLPDYIRHWGYFPSSAVRYCSVWLKQRPARIHLRKKFGRVTLHKVVGIRLDESAIRKWKYGSEACCKKYGGREIRPDREHCGSFMVMPILDWTKEDVLAYLTAKKVRLHEGYKLFGMSGCKWCPISRTEEVQAIAKVFPNIFDDLIQVEKEINKPAWYHKKIWLRDVVQEAIGQVR